jgi:hypothetical protein
VKHFTPNEDEYRKYVGYTVEIREAKTLKVYVTVQDAVVNRWTHVIRRVPSDKKFIVYLLIGASERERRAAVALSQRLPRGDWAAFPEWFRRRAKNGQVFYQQTRGVRAPDPFAQLELELMIDADANTRHRVEGIGRA